MFKSIRSVLFVSFVVIMLVSFLLFALLSIPNIKRTAIEQIENQLLKECMLVSDSFVNDAAKGRISDGLQNKIISVSKLSGARATLIDRNGKVLADSEEPGSRISFMADHKNRPEIIQAGISGSGSSVRYSSTLNRDLVYSAYALKDSNGNLQGYLRFAEPEIYVSKYVIKIYRSFVFAFILAVILVMIISYLFSIVFTKPVGRLMSITEKIAGGQFPHTIVRKSWFEIGDLEKRIEEMSEKLSVMFNELRFQQSRASAVFSGMKEGVLVIDPAGRVVSANQTAEKIFDISLGELKIKSVREVVRNNEIFDLIETTAKENKGFESEISISSPVKASFLVYTCPIMDKLENTLGVICVLHDITRVKDLEKFRSEFIANISHELKTPLTAIRSFAETLNSGALEDKENASKFLSRIHEHAKNLSVLIDDILELSRLEAGRAVGESKQIEISQIIEKTMGDLDFKAKAKNILLSTNLKKCYIYGLKDHIHRAIINIVDNAINYTNPGGRIVITCANEDNMVKVSVQDTGIGIPSESLPRIFERFYRVDSARSRETGGTGLGLSIVKHIMEIHNGSVSAESRVGEGSTFTLIFPKGTC